MKWRMLFTILCVLLGSLQSAFAAISSGSGFFITSDGYFVTNFHVIEGAEEISILPRLGQSLPAKVVRVDKANDLAILKVSGRFMPVVVGNSRSVRSGQRVITVGYPHVDVQGFEAKVTDGIINSLSGMRDDPRVFQISVPVQSGNSGGPLVAEDGSVIGIVVSKLSALNLLKETGDLPQNVNYAIKSNYLLELISSISGLDEKLAVRGQQKPKDSSDLTLLVEKSTSLVVASSRAETATTAAAKTTAVAPSDKQPKAALTLNDLVEKIAKGDFKSDYTMSVVAPSVAENGAVVPFNLNLSTPIVSGDTVYILVNDKYPVYLASVVGSTTMTFLSGRVRMPGGQGRISAVVVDSTGAVRMTSANVFVGIDAFFDNKERAKSIQTVKHRLVTERGTSEFKFLINYPASSLSFIKEVSARFSDGAIGVFMSPLASKNPFVGFKIGRPSNPHYKIYVKNNDGGVATEEGEAY